MVGGAIAPHSIAIVSTHSTRYNKAGMVGYIPRCLKGDRASSRSQALTLRPLASLAFLETRLDRHA